MRLYPDRLIQFGEAKTFRIRHIYNLLDVFSYFSDSVVSYTPIVNFTSLFSTVPLKHVRYRYVPYLGLKKICFVCQSKRMFSIVFFLPKKTYFNCLRIDLYLIFLKPSPRIRIRVTKKIMDPDPKESAPSGPSVS
jgi:hypothetical protein